MTVARPRVNEDDGLLLSRRTVGRVMAVYIGFFAGVLSVAGAFVLTPTAAGRVVITLLGALLIAIGLVLWYLPWPRWPRRASLWLIPLSCVLFVFVSTVAGLVGTTNPYRYGIYLVGLFAWIGVAHRRGTSLASTPLLLLTYLLPLRLTGLLATPSASAAFYIVLFCVLLGETLAWVVSRLNQAQSALRRSEERYRENFDRAALGMAVVGLDGRYQQVNAALCQMLGYSRDELLARRVRDIMLSEDIEDTEDDFAQIRTGVHERYQAEKQYIHRDGHPVWVEVNATLVREQGGRPLHMINQTQDITARKAAQGALRRSEEQYRRIVETAQEGIVHSDAANVIVYVNQRLADLLGYTVDELIGQPLMFIVAAEARSSVEANQRRRREGYRGNYLHDLKLATKNGATVWVIVSSTPVFDAAGRFLGGTAMLMDITERKQAEEAVRRSEEWFRTLSENATDLVTAVDTDGHIQYASPSHRGILGYDPPWLRGRVFWEFVHPDDRTAIELEWAHGLAATGVPLRMEYRIRHADGSWHWLESTARIVPAAPDLPQIIANSRDVTERKAAEDALRHQALHDTLTGLPNRTLLHDRVEQAIIHGQRDHMPLTLLLFDLDRFKEINDTFGHHHGDVVLQQVAERVRGAVRATDTVARLGGDEFALALAGPAAVGLGIAQTIAASLGTPVEVEGQALHLTVSIGVAEYPTHGADATTLLRCADVAMYVAKQDGQGVALYAPERDPHSTDRIMLIAELRQAIAAGDLTLHYQPQVEAATGTVCGVEALVRWVHPERGLIPPDRFIGLAEQTGQMGALTRWVLEATLAQAQRWQARGLAIPVAVNLCAANLLDAQLLSIVAELLATYAVPPTLLRLEVTESMLMIDMERALAVLSGLAGLGIGLAIDDFGAGYSSLAYLKRLPVSEIKIDRSFVQQMAEDASDAVIVRSTISLAHSLGRTVVAEGVETAEALRLLQEARCDVVQGYYLSRPLPAAECERWLRELDDRFRPRPRLIGAS